ncbi:MAG TPA: Fe-S cluster assembly protein SufD [Roseiflexaceae bacterium]|nr:Fe-S cluster assembly protein SufD [Roseiflexaceae bacterium]
MKYLPTLSELSDTALTAAARAAGEPEWLVERRAAAWRHFAQSEPPFWRRTDLTKFEPGVIRAPLGANHTAVQWDAALAAKGVVFTTLAAAVRAHEALVRQHLGAAADPLAHKFTALHAALWQDGVFLYVPKDTAIEVPLHAVITLAGAGHAAAPHNLIVVERGASVTFVEEFTSPDVDGQALALPATELFIGDGASVRYVSIQTWGRGVYHIGSQRARAGRDASLEWAAINLGGSLQHTEAETALVGDGSHVNWVAATFGGGEQTLLTAPWLRHIGARTEGHMDFKTVVKDRAYATFDGMIKIEHESRGTISRLEEHALHLTPKARSDSIPGLKIETNDVLRAGHASTSGEVDEEQLFYMRSRGIARTEAIHMIVMGFFEPVLDHIPSEKLRERIGGLIEAKI